MTYVHLEKFGSAVEVGVRVFLQTPMKSFGLQFKDKGLTFATRNHSSIVIAVYYKMLLVFISSCTSEIFLLLYPGI